MKDGDSLTACACNHRCRSGALIALAVAFLLGACVGSPIGSTTSTPESSGQPMDVYSVDLSGIVSRPRHDNDIKFTNLSLDQGLSQSVVTAIWQDQQGFLWFGTQDGLDRYDGNTFRVFKNDLADPTSLSNNYIYAIAEDLEGMLWIGTNGGLDRFDAASEQFEHFYHDSQNPNSLSSDIVGDLHVDGEGTLWVGTLGAGLNRFEDGSFFHYQNSADDPTSLSNDTIAAIYGDRDGNLWVGTIGGGLNKLDPTSGHFTRYQNDPNDPSSLADNTVTSIAEDEQGNLWLATSGGLVQMDKTCGSFTTYRLDPNDPASLSDNTVFAVFTDRAGTLWVGTNSGGLNRFDGETGLFVHYYPVPGDPTTLPTPAVFSIFQDRGGVLWFGTFGGGVSKYSWTSEKFSHIRPIQGDPNGLSDSGVWAFFEDHQGVFWIGTVAGGLNRVDPATGEFTHYLNDPGDPHSLSSNFVMSVYEDQEGKFWVGTFSGGLNRMDRNSGEFVRYPTPPNASCLLEDPGGTLWLCTSLGLGRYDAVTDSFGYLLNDPNDPTTLSDSNTTTAYQDRQGRLWVGTFSGGLNLFHPEDETFTRYRHDPEDPASLAADAVLSIHEDRNGILWIGTTGGLDQFEPTSETFVHYREQDGLPNEVIYGILEDDKGNLWLSTNRGVSRFNPQSKTFKNYTPADGLQSNEFNQGARYQDSQGRMYFGGINGFNVFRPDEIVDNPHVPPMVVTEFYLFNTPVVPGADSPLENAITRSDEIKLTYKQDFITFGFAALDYAAPERNQYAYLMEGLDEGWNEVATRSFAGYTNIPPGNYVFRVRGSNSDGIWNEAGTSINIAITPPFWQTGWFRGLAIALVVGTVVGGFTLRLRMVEGQRKRLEMLVAERTQELNEAMVELRRSRDAAQAANRAKSIFLANISHELRTPLNAILGFSRLMLDSSEARSSDGARLTRAQREDLEVINRSGEHLLGLINDVLEMSKIEAGRTTVNEHHFDLRRLLEDLEDMFRLRAAEKDLRLELQIAPAVPQHILADEGKLRQILMNLLSNAVKFTSEGGIVIRVGVRKAEPGEGRGDLTLDAEVEDTGVGIIPEEQESIFDPFVQSESGRQSQEGTGLGLSISRQYAELMGGDLSVKSQVGKGSVFTLEVPIQAVDLAAVQGDGLRRRVVGLEPGQPVYRLLVVDDKEVNRQLIVRLLAPLGFEVREAANGKEALDIWGSWEPHLIWMDMRMPVMDGYEATRRIKATVKGHATAIIALTASALEEDRQVILSEGCDDYIRKPFRDRELFEMLEKHLGVRFVYEEPYEEVVAPAPLPAGVARSRGTPTDMAERLAALPKDWVEELGHATRLGALDSILSAIAKIRRQDAALADRLEGWAEDFDHERILALIEASRGTDGHVSGQ